MVGPGVATPLSSGKQIDVDGRYTGSAPGNSFIANWVDVDGLCSR